MDVKGRKHEYECYGLDKIATADVPTPESLKKICSKFGLNPSQVRKPKRIDMLIALRASSHHPDRVKSIGQMSYYNGIFGKVLGGTDEDLVMKENYKAVNKIKTLTSRAVAKSVTLVNSTKVEKQCLGLDERKKMASEMKICRHYKFGYCKYGATCKLAHVQEICRQEGCEVKKCRLRHPKRCRYFSQFGMCNFNNCLYSHDVNQEIQS